MTDMGIGIAHMNKEEKLQKAIKKMQGFSSFLVTAEYHDNSNSTNPTTIIQCEIDAENENVTIEIFETTHPLTNCWQVIVINLDTKNGIARYYA